MPPPLLPLRVSKCPRVCWVPTPCGPMATHAVSPGMHGMSPAQWGSCQSLVQRLVGPCWETLFKHLRRGFLDWVCAEKMQRLLQGETKSFYVTGSIPNCPICLELKATSNSKMKLTRWVSACPLSLASWNTHGVRRGPTLRMALSEDFHCIITLN